MIKAQISATFCNPGKIVSPAIVLDVVLDVVPDVVSDVVSDVVLIDQEIILEI